MKIGRPEPDSVGETEAGSLNYIQDGDQRVKTSLFPGTRVTLVGWFTFLLPAHICEFLTVLATQRPNHKLPKNSHNFFEAHHHNHSEADEQFSLQCGLEKNPCSISEQL